MLFGEEVEGLVTKCHVSILSFITKGKSSKGYWVTLCTPGVLKGTLGHFGDKTNLIPKRLADSQSKNKESTREYYAKKEGTTTCQACK